MSTALWIIALVLIGAAFCESATSGILAVCGIAFILFIWFGLTEPL